MTSFRRRPFFVAGNGATRASAYTFCDARESREGILRLPGRFLSYLELGAGGDICGSCMQIKEHVPVQCKAPQPLYWRPPHRSGMLIPF